MKLAEVEESRLEAAREPRLDVRDPGLLPEDRDCMLLERLGAGRKEKVSNAEPSGPPGTSFLAQNSTTATYNIIFLDPLDSLRGDPAPPFH